MPFLVKFGKDLVKFGVEEASLRLFLPDYQVRQTLPNSPVKGAAVGVATGQSGAGHRTVR